MESVRIVDSRPDQSEAMGFLNNGIWNKDWYDTGATKGRFVREESKFRNWVTPDGSAGPTGGGGFRAEPNRYRLYVSLACPWSHRTLIYRELKALQEHIPLSVTHWLMGPDGWTFQDGDGVIPDPVVNAELLRDLYLAADPNFTGHVTVPVLWDNREETIVSNESADIIRMFNSAFDGVGAREGDFYPEDKRAEIERLNARIYETLNNGVYKCGFATTQEAYDEAVIPLFETMDMLDRRLAKSRYLCGAGLTEADWRLLPTLVRFDVVYCCHFKCNLRRLVDYENLWPYARDLYQVPGIARTVDFHHIERHYYQSHTNINPHQIVPIGPETDWDAPRGRGP